MDQQICIKIETIDELKYVIDICKNDNIPITILGNGSNVLVKDRRNKRSNNKTKF